MVRETKCKAFYLLLISPMLSSLTRSWAGYSINGRNNINKDGCLNLNCEIVTKSSLQLLDLYEYKLPKPHYQGHKKMYANEVI